MSENTLHSIVWALLFSAIAVIATQVGISCRHNDTVNSEIMIACLAKNSAQACAGKSSGYDNSVSVK